MNMSDEIITAELKTTRPNEHHAVNSALGARSTVMQDTRYSGFFIGVVYDCTR